MGRTMTTAAGTPKQALDHARFTVKSPHLVRRNFQKETPECAP
jgi:hypothetical protein